MISIIVPIYNVEKYLTKCLDSIKCQTYSDFEVLMIDDGSTDRSSDIARSYENDERFKYYYQQNQGLSSARNTGLDYMHGDYVCFIDSDDYIDPKYLELLKETLLTYNADFVQCKVMRVRENGQQIPSTLHKEDKIIITDIKEYIKKSSFSVWNKLYKASLYKNHRFTNGITFEDFALSPQIYFQAKKIASCNEFLYFYLYRESSITNINRIKPDILKAFHILERSEFGKRNPDIMGIFFVRQVIGSFLWTMAQENGYNNQIINILTEGLKKYPSIPLIYKSYIGKHKKYFCKQLLASNFNLALLYAKAYNNAYKLLRRLLSMLR